MSSNALTNTTISKTYVGVLHARGSQLPASGQRDIYDGVGQRSAIKLGRGCNGATICGPLSATEILSDSIKIGNTNVIDVIYPVGAVIFNTGINPSAHIPNTTWVQISQGKFIVGVGSGVDQNNVSKTFTLSDNSGEYQQTLTINQIPAHRHIQGISSTPAWALSEQGQYGLVNTGVATRASQNGSPPLHTNYPFTETVGGGQPHENTPPSFGLFVWQRTQ